jgi:hypothetical protein
MVIVIWLQLDPYVRVKWEPWLHGNERYEGFYVDVLHEVGRRSGLSFQMRLVPDGQVGSPGDDGSWNGLIGQISLGVSSLLESIPLPIHHPERSPT